MIWKERILKNSSKDIENHLCFILKDNGEMLFFTKNANSTEELFAMWTNSKSMVYSMKLLFKSLWTSSKNIHLGYLDTKLFVRIKIRLRLYIQNSP